jgi:hypothetical protein
VEDVRRFALPPATLILILDVLQYLDREEQLDLLGRCGRALEPGGKLIFRVQDEERGLYSRFSMGLDRIIFALGRAGRRPFMLTGEAYQRVLEDEGLDVRQVRFRNRLPLAHRLVIGVKGAPGSEGQDRKSRLVLGGADPLVGVPSGPGRPRPAAGTTTISLLQGASRPTGASAADQGVRPTKPLGTASLRPASKLKHAPPKASGSQP